MFEIFFFCNSTTISFAETKIKGLPSKISVTTTPEVFLGNFRSIISSLFKSLIKIFNFSILTYLLVSGSDLVSALNYSEDSNLPNKTFFEINF